jgi:hypothetical protein
MDRWLYIPSAGNGYVLPLDHQISSIPPDGSRRRVRDTFDIAGYRLQIRKGRRLAGSLLVQPGFRDPA